MAWKPWWPDFTLILNYHLETRPMRHSVAVYINTKNCAELLLLTFPPLLAFDEIIVADVSTDSSVRDYVTVMGQHVKYFHSDIDDLHLRFLSLLDKIESEYVLGIDSDELVTDDLKSEIFDVLRFPCEFSGFLIPSWMYNYGFEFGLAPPSLRLFKKTDFVLTLDEGAHTLPKVSGPTPLLSSPYLHMNNPKLGMTAVKHFRYGGITAARMNQDELEVIRLDKQSNLQILFHAVHMIARINYMFFREILTGWTWKAGYAGLCLGYSVILRLIADDVCPTEEYRMRKGLVERGNRGYY